MIFYKNIFISAILSAIILLVIVAVVMYYTKKKQIFPPTLGGCPDYYNLNEFGQCVNNGTWTLTDDTACNFLDFSLDEYNVQGTGPTSGICQKKRLANGCKISWDGITNNYSIC
jgi:hypothetical protein